MEDLAAYAEFDAEPTAEMMTFEVTRLQATIDQLHTHLQALEECYKDRETDLEFEYNTRVAVEAENQKLRDRVFELEAYIAELQAADDGTDDAVSMFVVTSASPN